ncbi:MAG: Class diheme cytochrome c [Xanthobacteraceae bacterium]|nr:Class diheme cytochrome c [Xanthobacteraceae bacterium]
MIRTAWAGPAAFVLAMLAAPPAALAQSPAERGGYLVNTIMTCNNCHTPMGPGGPQFDKALSGGITFDEPPFRVQGSNITQDKETGIGAWTDAQIKQTLRTGKRPNGVQLAEVMPTSFYGIVTPRDMDAIVAYLRTVKPVANKTADPVYKIALPHHSFPGAEKPFTDADLNDKVKKGFYLVTIGHCMECHTPFGSAGQDYAGKLGAGGREFPGPWGKSVSRNITSSKTKGLGEWTDAQIKHAITHGESKDGSKLKPPMGYPYYAKMAEADLDAIVAYLRTVPAKD